MDNTIGPNENGTFHETYSRSTRKKSRLGRSGLTEAEPKREHYKMLLSQLTQAVKDANEGCDGESNGSLICANDSLLNGFDSSGAHGSNTDTSGTLSMEVEHEHSTSNSEALLNNLCLCGSRRRATCEADNSQTHESGCSHTEIQNTGPKTTNEMHEAMTHPPHRSTVSFLHHSIVSKDVMIQSSSTPYSGQKFVHQSVNRLPSHKETEKVQVPPLISNKDVFSANSKLLKDIPNNPDMVISRIRTPFKAVNTQSFAVPVSESHTKDGNSSSLYNKENVVPTFFSTPIKSENVCAEYENAFRTLSLTGRKDGQGPVTPIPGTAYKPFCIPNFKTPISENTKSNASVPQQRLDVFPTHFLNNTGACEVAMDLSLSSNASKTVLPATAGGEVSSAALQEVGSSLSQKGPENGPCQSQKDDGKYLIVNGKKYKVESLLGRGGSSKVYQVLHLDTLEHLAIKCVNLSDTEPEIAQGYHNEIKLLQKLQGSENVIRMFDYEYVPDKQILYVVLEKGETDLSKVLKGLSSISQLPIPTVINYWLEMLAAVKCIHINGIIHSDLKPANFLIVNGHLKLIDFGIASSIQNGMTSVSKDIATGTFNYMSPEAIQEPTDSDGNNQKIKINYKSDIWSLGCILYNLLYGRTPFQHIKQVWVKLATIKNYRTKIQYPPLPQGCPGILLKALKLCLQYNPKQRPSAEELQVLPYQGYLQMELVMNRIQILAKSNSNSEDVVKAINTLIDKYNTVFN